MCSILSLIFAMFIIGALLVVVLGGLTIGFGWLFVIIADIAVAIWIIVKIFKKPKDKDKK